jgi:hypothetical protein
LPQGDAPSTIHRRLRVLKHLLKAVDGRISSTAVAGVRSPQVQAEAEGHRCAAAESLAELLAILADRAGPPNRASE